MQTISLWPGPTPHAKGHAARDIPTLDIYEPFGTKFSDSAILMLPGGGYGGLSRRLKSETSGKAGGLR
ncbi:MAG: hypothetical protein WC076_06655 [Terrimicrobiaceae bacterium]|nr:hypothetical protein [Terrimicrobiaceae bacterium]